MPGSGTSVVPASPKGSGALSRDPDWIDSASGPVDVLGHPAEVLAWRLGRGAGPTVRLRDGSLPGEPPPWM